MTSQISTPAPAAAPAPIPAHRRHGATLVRYTVPIAALFAAGPLAYSITSELTSGTGGADTSFLLAQSQAAGLTALLASLALAAIFVALGAVLIGAKAGLVSGGYVLAWAAWGVGDLTTLFRSTPDLSAMTMITLAVEAAVVAAGSLGMLILAAKLDRHPKATMHEFSARAFVKDLVSVSGLVPVLAAAAAAVVATVVIAQTGMKGQTVFAALVAGIGASIAAHSATNSETPHPYAPFFGVALAAILAPIVALVYPGIGELPKDISQGGFLGYLRVQPADWGVALLVGVPIGLGWTGTLLPNHEEHH